MGQAIVLMAAGVYLTFSGGSCGEQSLLISDGRDVITMCARSPWVEKKIEQTRKYCHRNLLKLITYKYADLKDRRSKVIQHKNIFQRPTPISSI